MPFEQTVLAGLQAVMQAQDARADNLANVDTPGFRRRVITTSRFRDAVRSRLALDPTPARRENTQGPLDLALDGQGYLVVLTASGPALTRGGSFQRAADGRLVDSSGAALAGRAGPLTVPEGPLEVTPEGGVHVGGREIDRLRRAWSPPEGLQPLGAGLLRPRPDAPVRVSDVAVVQGAIEGSNVEPVVEMCGMMENLRHVEMLLQALRAADEMAERTATEVGATR